MNTFLIKSFLKFVVDYLISYLDTDPGDCEHRDKIYTIILKINEVRKEL